MDLGLDFDDSDFERKKKTTAGAKTSYNAKVCSHLWFEDEEAPDPNTYIHQQKFSADYHFYQGNYETAVTKYRMLLERIPESNLPLRQDVQESLCRSYTKLGRHQDSTAIAYKLVQTRRSEDEARQQQSLLLLSQACKGAQDWTGCISALEELVSRQSHYAYFWLELGRAYHHSLQDKRDSHLRMAQVLTCYIRARMLLESVMNTVGQTIKERNETTICKINKEIVDLGASQELVDQAVEVMRTDLEHILAAGDEDTENIDEAAAFSSESFKRRWFSWIKKYYKKT